MTNNTDLVRALIGEMTDYLDQEIDPELDVIEQWRDQLAAALASAPPSAPVGVDLSNWAQHYSIGPDALDALRNLLSLAQQPAAPHWGNVPELDDEQPAAPSGEAVAFVPVHPRMGPLWSDTYPAGSAADGRSPNYEHRPLFYAAPQQPAGVGGVPQAWISDNDLLKLHESVDEARNIRMSVRRTNTRVHPIYIPALAAQQQEPKS